MNINKANKSIYNIYLYKKWRIFINKKKKVIIKYIWIIIDSKIIILYIIILDNNSILLK